MPIRIFFKIDSETRQALNTVKDTLNHLQKQIDDLLYTIEIAQEWENPKTATTFTKQGGENH